MRNSDLISRELEEIRRARGSVTAEAVVAAATPETSPLHSEFEWDDTKAGHQYRLGQARELIHIAVTVQRRDGESVIAVPAFVDGGVEGNGGRRYISIDDARTDSALAERVMVKELECVASALRRAQAIAAALGLMGNVTKLLADALKLRAELKHGSKAA